MSPKNFLVKGSQKCNSTKSTQFTYLHQCAKMPRHMQKCAKWARGGKTRSSTPQNGLHPNANDADACGVW